MTARGTAPLEIRGFEPPDRDALIELHRISFVASGEPTYGTAARRFEGLLDAQHTLVARRSERIVGFVAFHLFDEHPLQRLAIARTWLWSRLPDREGRIVEWLRRHTPAEKRARIRVQHLLRVGEERRAGPRPGPADGFVTDFAVAEEARRTGVGRALVRELLLRLTRASVPRVWVTTWQAGPSAQLFEGIGFTPLLELTPSYSDGSASRLLVRDVAAAAASAGEADAAGVAHERYAGAFDPAARDGIWDVLLQLPAVALMAHFGADVLAREPITALGLTLLCGALAIRPFDRRQWGDRAVGSRYVITASGITEHRADGGMRTLHVAAPLRCAPAALRVGVFRVARLPVALRVSSPAGSTVIGPLEWVDATLFAEELDIRFGGVRFPQRAHTMALWFGRVVMNVLPALAVLAIAPVWSRSVMLAGLGASALVAVHRVRCSLIWNDGSPRALWPMAVTAAIATVAWFVATG